MFVRRCLTLACATALAVAPGTALAVPADRPPVREIPMKAKIPTVPAAAQPSAAPIVREVQTDGDSTLPLVISGSALLIAAGAVALSGHDHRRLSRLA